jgi:hypothetical protein
MCLKIKCIKSQRVIYGVINRYDADNCILHMKSSRLLISKIKGSLGHTSVEKKEKGAYCQDGDAGMPCSAN